ncbi:CPBP family intramembrane glutamic endopeptidase [Microbulbifer celer]|uniref:CPBP family intramembrane glutamic endopeptidase n=1 Tax=Microbulbifer celer TaxID=435905 RepID=A0ABW3UAT3_9GAMM|nr:CPBP family intramembrane glutamic endopeptidase [Microbulbifer celer]UFN59028.1 CPBP family intramembrane metalloprotease [Microbulbifer celer]
MKGSIVEKIDINPVKALGMALAIQGVALALSLVGLQMSAVDVSWWGAKNESLGIAVAVLLGLLGAIVTYVAAWWLTRSDTLAGATLREHCRALHPFFRHFSWGQIGILALAAGVCEELLFRGFLQPWLIAVSSPVVGILVAAVAFGLMHFASWIYFAVTCVVGIVFGGIYWLTDNLLLVVIWHGIYDLIAIGVVAKYPHWLGVTAES